MVDWQGLVVLEPDGTPLFAGTRVPLGELFGHVGLSLEGLLEAYPILSGDHVTDVMRIAKREVLEAYSRGDLPRGVAMRALGIDWYGDLLVWLNALSLPHPRVPPNDAAKMRDDLNQWWSKHGNDAGA